MKNKLIIIVCAFALCFSLLAIPSFALENDFTGDYEFSYWLDFNPLNINSSYLDFQVAFTCQGVEYDMMSFIHNINTGITTMNYWIENESILAYSSANGWVNDEYRYIYINDFDRQSGHTVFFMTFLLDNKYVPEPNYNGWYYDIYDMLHSAIFDGNDLIGYQDLTLSLLSTIFCLVAFAIPILVVLMFIKFVLSMRFI